MRRIVQVLVCLALVGGVAACGDDDDPVAGSADNTLTISERDYSFDVSGELDAGAVTIDVTNDGDEFHEIAMAKLLDGKTIDDVRSKLESADPEGEDPLEGIVDENATIDDLGGVQLPGTSYAISGRDIDAGEYVLLCFLPNSEGKPHHSLGMLTGFTVGEDEATELPEGDVVYTATDEELSGPDKVDAGTTTIEVVNDSKVNREISVLKIKDGKTIEDVGAWFESGNDGPPDPAGSPLDFLAFVFDADQDRTITLELTPGQWAIQSGDPEKPFEGPPTEDPHAVLFTVT